MEMFPFGSHFVFFGYNRTVGWVEKHAFTHLPSTDWIVTKRLTTVLRHSEKITHNVKTPMLLSQSEMTVWKLIALWFPLMMMMRAAVAVALVLV